MAIEFNEAMEMLAAASGRLETEIQETRAEWAPDDPPATILFSAMGKRIASAVDDIAKNEAVDVFNAVEALLTKGSETVRNAVATGLLESLLNAASANRCDFTKVNPFLGHASKEYCREWDRFTGCATPGLD